MAKDQVVLISDLHIDSWLENNDGQQKKARFLDFLNDIEADTNELYIVGDLLDMPPYKQTQQDLMAEFGDVLGALYTFSLSVKVFWLIGNHDIGLCGARLLLPGVSIWYPHICYQPPNKPGMRIMLEHGHQYDPLMAAYAKDLATLSYYGDSADQPLPSRSDLANSMLQRRNINGTAKYLPGMLTMARDTAGGFLGWAKRKCEEIVKDCYTVDHWRQQAAIAARQHSNLSGQDSQIDAIVFGHTHCPDCAKVSYKPGIDYQYYNTGSWVASEPCMPSLVIKDDGTIQRRCFGLPKIDNLSDAQCGPDGCALTGKAPVPPFSG